MCLFRKGGRERNVPKNIPREEDFELSPGIKLIITRKGDKSVPHIGEGLKRQIDGVTVVVTY